jgi:hypothetical protein
MHSGVPPFAQLMKRLPPIVFERCVARYGGGHKKSPSERAQ